MTNGKNSENGDPKQSLGIFFGTAGSVSYFSGYSAISLPQGMDAGIGPLFIPQSANNPRDLTGGQLVFQDKFAVVTGAASGIGLACVERLQDFGYQLQLLDIHTIIGSQIEKIDLSKENPRLKRAPDV